MSVYHHRFQIETDPRPEFYDVTDEVKEAIRQSGIMDGIVAVYSPHTTCSIIIQEDSLDETYNGTKFLFQDLLDILDGLVPACRKEGQYMHPGPKCVEYSVNVVQEAKAWTLNTDAHLRSALIGRSESIPLVGSTLELGEHGRIYFADFDGTRARPRQVHVQIVGE